MNFGIAKSSSDFPKPHTTLAYGMANTFSLLYSTFLAYNPPLRHDNEYDRMFGRYMDYMLTLRQIFLETKSLV